MHAKDFLISSFPLELVENLMSSYEEVTKNFQLSNWKISELDAGHFVETVRRVIEYSLFGEYTPLATRLGSFSPAVLTKYENAQGDDSLRTLIPRTLYSIYCIRNKRGVGHVGAVSPNEMDATYILYAVKWVLAELVRLASLLSPHEASLLIHKMIEREIDPIWDDGESFMVLNKKMSAKEKVLLVLYRRDNLMDCELQKLVEYKNASQFRAILIDLKKNRLIDYTTDKRCKISPLGCKRVEHMLTVE